MSWFLYWWLLTTQPDAERQKKIEEKPKAQVCLEVTWLPIVMICKPQERLLTEPPPPKEEQG